MHVEPSREMQDHNICQKPLPVSLSTSNSLRLPGPVTAKLKQTRNRARPGGRGLSSYKDYNESLSGQPMACSKRLEFSK